MLTSERKTFILGRLRVEGRVVAKDIAQALDLSEDTIRRDLRELAGEGLLQRVHGGALPASPALADLKTRRKVSSEGKAEIAKAAAGMVQPGQIVFLDGGTTTVALARSLPAGLAATVVTHSPDIAVALADHPSIEVELIGGRLYKHSNVTIGAVAVEAITRIRPDLYFMGATGIHPEFGISTGDREEAAIKRTILRMAAETFVLASREKIGAVSAYGIAETAEIAGLIVDRAVADDELQAFRARGLSITRA